MKRVFSFCIYGEKRTYLEGLLRNLEFIGTRYPSFEKHVYVGCDISEDFVRMCEAFPSTHAHRLGFTGGRLMSSRFLAIDLPGVDMMLVRDADSRITERDCWCIDDFIGSQFGLFTIRDHKFHSREVMGGLWGMRRIQGFSMHAAYADYAATTVDLERYQSDQDFLRNHVYRPFRKNFLAYTSTWAFPGENARRIGVPRKDVHDFCGNVIIVDELGERPQFEANDDLPDDFRHLIRLHKHSRDGVSLRFSERLRAFLSGD